MGAPICCQEEKKKPKSNNKINREDNDESEKPKEKNNKKKEIDKNKNKNEIIVVKTALNQMSKEQTKIYLEGLFKSYYAAKTYFNENELKEKELEAINACKKIISAQEKLKEGKYKEINIAELPSKVTSEFITGYTPEKRKQKILELIKKLMEEKAETRKSMDIKIAEMKKNFHKLKDSDKIKLKQVLDQDKSHIDSVNKEIENIKKTLVSDYIPIPLYFTTSKECKKEKLNLEIEENAMKIKINGISYTKSNPIVMLGIHGDKINVEKQIKGSSQNDMTGEFIWNFNEEQFKNLVKYNLQIILGRTYTLKPNKVKGLGELPLRKLKDTSSVYESVSLKMKSGKSDTFIEIEIFLRRPLIDKEYEDDFREIIKIEKIYPEFVFKE